MTDRKEFRYDIQFLRGIAVLLVVLFHAFEANVPRGFLGVDVFFVISGFLVTSAIVRELDSGRFDLRSFYFRRLRRIVPAVLSTLILTTLAGYWILTSTEWREYLRQLIACVLFSANFLLSHRGGYFGPAPETEPLRHFWSLAVEEQYYLVIPLILIAVPQRWRFHALSSIATVSLLLCIIGSTAAPTLTFYQLPTRGWELLAGALCGFTRVRARLISPGWACWAALGVVIALSFIGLNAAHPRGDAILVVLATCVVLLGRDKGIARNWLTAPIARIGDWSFSLYLLHWPILSFAHLAYPGALQPWHVIAAIILSIGLAALQFELVEKPFWRDWKIGDGRRWRQFIALTMCLGFVSLPAAASHRDVRAADTAELRPSTGLAGCRNQVYGGPFPMRCRSGGEPVIAIWGDSFAMHLIDGIRADPLLADTILQVTSAACPPVQGMAPLRPGRGISEARKCIGFNERALSLIVNSSVSVVVVSSTFGGVLADNGRRILADGKVVHWNVKLAEHFLRAMQALRRSGKAVLIVGPTPREDFDVARCNLQIRERLLLLGRRDCDIHTDALDGSYRGAAAALPAVARMTGARLLMPADALCTGKTCRASSEGRLLYRDKGHLTRFGSIYVASRMRLNAQLRWFVNNHRNRVERSRTTVPLPSN